MPAGERRPVSRDPIARQRDCHRRRRLSQARRRHTQSSQATARRAELRTRRSALTDPAWMALERAYRMPSAAQNVLRQGQCLRLLESRARQHRLRRQHEVGGNVEQRNDDAHNNEDRRDAGTNRGFPSAPATITARCSQDQTRTFVRPGRRSSSYLRATTMRSESEQITDALTLPRSRSGYSASAGIGPKSAATGALSRSN